MTVINKEGYPCWAFLDSRMRQCFASEEMFLLGKRWYEHPAIQATTMKQGFERIQENADTFLESLGYRHTVNGYEAIRPNTERVALFAHQGFGLAFLSAVLDIPYPLFSLRFDMGHTGMTVIEFGAGEGLVIPRVLQLSNDSHIYKEGLETSYQNEILI